MNIMSPLKLSDVSNKKWREMENPCHIYFETLTHKRDLMLGYCCTDLHNFLTVSCTFYTNAISNFQRTTLKTPFF